MTAGKSEKKVAFFYGLPCKNYKEYAKTDGRIVKYIFEIGGIQVGLRICVTTYESFGRENPPYVRYLGGIYGKDIPYPAGKNPGG